MIVLDTHVWLWWSTAPTKLSRVAARAIERADRIGVSAASIYEVAQLVDRGRVVLDTPVRTWVRSALGAARVESIAIDAEIAIDAAQLRVVADPFDRIIYATAVANDAPLITRDERLRRLDETRTLW